MGLESEFGVWRVVSLNTGVVEVVSLNTGVWRLCN